MVRKLNMRSFFSIIIISLMNIYHLIQIQNTVQTVHGVLKARILKWFAIPFSSEPRFVTMNSPP